MSINTLPNNDIQSKNPTQNKKKHTRTYLPLYNKTTKTLKMYKNGELFYTLSEPNDANETCPVTLDSMNNHNLDFLPEQTFPNKRHPSLLVMQLNCGHRFCALNRFFQMLHNDVRCPLCRQGATSTCKPSDIPKHVRKLMIDASKKMHSLSKHDDSDQNMIQEYLNQVIRMIIRLR